MRTNLSGPAIKGSKRAAERKNAILLRVPPQTQVEKTGVRQAEGSNHELE